MSENSSFMGVATLARMSFAGADLLPLAEKMVEQVELHPEDAPALMDLSTVFRLLFKPAVAETLQSRALDISRCYHLPAPGGTAEVRLLAFMTPGDLMANAPLDFLLEGSRISLDMVYVDARTQVPAEIPEHDIAYVAVADSDENLPVLEMLRQRLGGWARPVLNLPEYIGRTTRESTFEYLSGAPSIEIAPHFRLSRSTLRRVAEGDLSIAEVAGGCGYPIIVRPVDSHAGHGLEKLDGNAGDASSVHRYLSSRSEEQFYVSAFNDYRSPDGLFRKYRVALIDGKPYASHMAISSNWMVHYLNAGMAESEEKRREEERFMERFDADFAIRHAEAFRTIYERFELDYLVIDCAEAQDGRLLVFEVDSSAVVHAMDSTELFPYKQTQMRKVFAAFQQMIRSRCDIRPERI